MKTKKESRLERARARREHRLFRAEQQHAAALNARHPPPLAVPGAHASHARTLPLGAKAPSPEQIAQTREQWGITGQPSWE